MRQPPNQQKHHTISSPHSGKRPTLIDAMVLVAATAFGTAWSRQYLPWWNSPWETRGIRPVESLSFWTNVVLVRITVVLPCFLAWTLVLLAFQRHQPRRRRLIRFPGVGTSITTALILSVVALSGLFEGLGESSLNTWLEFQNTSYRALHRFAEVNGMAIAATWTITALNGSWHSNRDWDETMGRVLGAFWISMSILRFWIYPVLNFYS